MHNFGKLIKTFMEAEHSYGCVIVDLEKEDATACDNWVADRVRKEEFHSEHKDRGRPHITVKYGLHAVDTDKVREVIELFNQGAIVATLGSVSLFETEEYDVIKVEVHSPDLHRLNALICENIRCTDTYPTYAPHITLAYVHKGLGWRYAGDQTFYGSRVVFREVVYSNTDGKKTKISL